VIALNVTVYGEAQPAGSKRAFVNPKTGRAIVTDDAKGSRPWKTRVAQIAGEAYDGPLLDGPLAVRLSFFRPRPQGHYGSGRNVKEVRPSAPSHWTTRPDVLKLARAVEDALTKVVWTDDARIVDEHLLKDWGVPARVEIEVRTL
jgi:Holliday junction resolvase RusA-like endonuclease